jgi:hypothetical protein
MHFKRVTRGAISNCAELLALLDARTAAFTPCSPVTFEGLRSRFRILSEESMDAPLREALLRTLEPKRLRARIRALQVHLFLPGDYVLPVTALPGGPARGLAQGPELRWHLYPLTSSERDGITLSAEGQLRRIPDEAGMHIDAGNDWYWVSPTLDARRYVLLLGETPHAETAHPPQRDSQL